MAEQESVVTQEMRDSIERGYGLFVRKNPEGNKKAAGCLGCHTDFGRQSGYMYDDWGTLVRPRDLTRGLYRGGRRPVDIYYRIHSGIVPSKMPTQPAEIASDPKAMWDLVNFVRALPYPAMLPDNVRQKVYGETIKSLTKRGLLKESALKYNIPEGAGLRD